MECGRSCVWSGQWNVVDRVFGQVKPKTIKLVFAASALSMQSKSKDWLNWNQDNVSEWNNISTCELLLQ